MRGIWKSISTYLIVSIIFLVLGIWLMIPLIDEYNNKIGFSYEIARLLNHSYYIAERDTVKSKLESTLYPDTIEMFIEQHYDYTSHEFKSELSEYPYLERDIIKYVNLEESISGQSVAYEIKFGENYSTASSKFNRIADMIREEKIMYEPKSSLNDIIRITEQRYSFGFIQDVNYLITNDTMQHYRYDSLEKLSDDKNGKWALLFSMVLSLYLLLLLFFVYQKKGFRLKIISTMRNEDRAVLSVIIFGLIISLYRLWTNSTMILTFSEYYDVLLEYESLDQLYQAARFLFSLTGDSYYEIMMVAILSISIFEFIETHGDNGIGSQESDYLSVDYCTRTIEADGKFEESKSSLNSMTGVHRNHIGKVTKKLNDLVVSYRASICDIKESNIS